MSDTCNCNSGITLATPVEIFNRPGLSALSYRVGLHADFKASLIAALTLSGQPALNGLSTRDNDDFIVALLDSWSVLADVLSFYQERIANESYLRTATERLSVLELARLIDYELRPGVAAGTYLAFKLDDHAGALTSGIISGQGGYDLPAVTIETGTKVQSIPGPDEVPQTFETIERIDARAEWNTIKPRLTQPQRPDRSAKRIVFNGLNNDIKAGDILYIRHPVNPGLKSTLRVSADINAEITWVDLTDLPVMPAYEQPEPVTNGSLSDFSTKVQLEDTLLMSILSKTWKREDLMTLIEMQEWRLDDFISSVNRLNKEASTCSESAVYIFRKRASVFGYNAVKQITYNGNIPKIQSEWTEWPITMETKEKLFLDQVIEGILPQSFVAIQKSDQAIEDIEVLQINQVINQSRTAYGLSSKTTLLKISPSANWWDSGSVNDLSLLRNLAIYVQSEKLELAETSIEEPVKGDTLELQTLDLSLTAGHKLIVTGNRTDLPAVRSTEVVTIKQVIIERGLTFLLFNESLEFSYIRTTVAINANVAYATNGQTVKEVLGNGDASKAYQRFILKQPPLTYISAGTPSGAESTLKVRVNDILWKEVDSFPDHTPYEKIYLTQLDDEGKTTLIFGDGINGSRLPTGQNNVRAEYRREMGVGGLVKAYQLSQLITRPLGVKEVSNPLAATGAADRENIKDAKKNATLNIHTLGRIVSLKDYEDFAKAFSGIDKALATWAWLGQKRGILITVAGANAELVPENSILYKNLLNAVRSAGDPNIPLIIKTYEPVYFRLIAKIQVDSSYNPDNTLIGIKGTLQHNFSFHQRQFGQGVSASEVISIIQQVKGVVAVDLDKLHRLGEAEVLHSYLKSDHPQAGSSNVKAAELLVIDSGSIQLTIMS